jgi:hypothetical protein
MPPPDIYRIIPTEGARLMIKRDDGTSVLGNEDYPTEELAVAALQGLAKSHGMEMVVRYRPDGKVDRVMIGQDLTTDRPPVTMTLTLPAILGDAVDELSEALGVSRDEVIRRAITLLKVAFDANGEGNRLAILTSDDEIVRDIVGVRPAKPRAKVVDK